MSAKARPPATARNAPVDPSRRDIHPGFEISSGSPIYLVYLEGGDSCHSQLHVTDDYRAFADRSYLHRMASPIFAIVRGTKPPVASPRAVHFIFARTADDTFGVIAELLTLGKADIYLSHGNAEVICVHGAEVSVDRVRRLAKNGEVAMETWRLQDSRIMERTPAFAKCSPPKPPLDFDRILKLAPDPEGYLMREVYNLLTRRRDGAALTLRPEDLQLEDYIRSLEWNLGQTTHPEDRLDEFWRFTGAHTASVSQRFSGVPPIGETPCPVGGFELLGLGKALRATRQFGAFIFRRFQGASLSQHIENFAAGKKAPDAPAVLHLPLPKVPSNLPTRTAISEIFAADVRKLGHDTHLDLLAEEKSKKKKKRGNRLNIAPIVHYFSAQNGFHYETLGISLPLQTVSSANTLQWNLRSLTHEYCHVIAGCFIDAAQTYLAKMPDARYQILVDDLIKQARLLAPLQAATPLELFAKALLYSQILELSEDDARAALAVSNKMEMRAQNEVITLVFDLVYFFRGNVTEHLQLYWSHWLSLPSIRTKNRKLIEYTIRSCCAIAVAYLDDSDEKPASLCIMDVLVVFRKILRGLLKVDRRIVRNIEELIKDPAIFEEIEFNFRNYLPLLCVTRALLISDKAAENLYRGHERSSVANIQNWSRTRRLEYRILEGRVNPLEFLRASELGSNTDEAGSIWLLTLLDVISNEP